MKMEGEPFRPEADRGEFSEITLRPFDLSDADDLMIWATDDEVTKFCTWDTYVCRDQAVDFIANHAIPHPWLRAICLEGRAIGSIAVTPAGPGIGRGRAELGYALASEYWGKGIVTRAVKMVVSTIFREWPELERLEALVFAENVGSQKVLEKAGFQREGVLRKYAFIKGRSRDLVIFVSSRQINFLY
ncbi:Amino-acid N-acetyltransferase [Bertholletia excelsa]